MSIISKLRNFMTKPDFAREKSSGRRSPKVFATGGELSPESVARVITACEGLQDNEPCGPDIYSLLEAAMWDRREACGIIDRSPSNPVVTALRVRRSGLPDWWTQNGNLLLAAADAEIGEIAHEIGGTVLPRNSLAVVGAGGRVHILLLTGEGALCVLGDRVQLRGDVLSALGGSTLLIGEDTISTASVNASAKNGGALVVGAEGLWALGVWIMTDDFHAIRDRHTGVRINKFGGRIVVDRHVWLGLGVTLMGDCYIGEDSIVGQGATVKDAFLASGTISIGRPARVVREGVTWTLEDLP